MSTAAIDSLWESGMRALGALERDVRLARINHRWKSLLAAVHRRQRKEALKCGGRLTPKKPAEEPAFLAGCMDILRRLAVTRECRWKAAKVSSIPETVREVSDKIRTEQHEGKRTIPWLALPQAEKQAGLELLQSVKDAPTSLSQEQRMQLWTCVDLIRRRAMRFAAKPPPEPDWIHPNQFKRCEEWIRKLASESDPAWDFHAFNGLLAEVARAFIKDTKQALSAVEEETFALEDTRLHPNAPMRFSTPPVIEQDFWERLNQQDWWVRLKRWWFSK